jgi:BirA family biotin operon repressor/biotin-[acetyl-CoA-carboxylase] ligase
MVCGLAIVDAVRAETGLNVGLKWPNDILINGTKAGGILTELELQRGSARDSSARGGVEFAVVGIGLNVNLDPMWLPQGLLAPATSLSHALGHTVDRLRLLLEFLAALETRYSSLLEGHLPNSEWAQRLETLGQQVRVTSAGQVWEGVAEGVDPDGGLLVRLDDGQQIGILAGDVTLRAPAPELSRKGPYGTEKAH